VIRFASNFAKLDPVRPFESWALFGNQIMFCCTAPLGKKCWRLCLFPNGMDPGRKTESSAAFASCASSWVGGSLGRSIERFFVNLNHRNVISDPTGA